MAPSTGLFLKQTRHSTWRGWAAILEGVGALHMLVGCRLPPLDGYVAVCLVLTIEVYDCGLIKWFLQLNNHSVIERWINWFRFWLFRPQLTSSKWFGVAQITRNKKSWYRRKRRANNIGSNDWSHRQSPFQFNNKWDLEPMLIMKRARRWDLNLGTLYWKLNYDGAFNRPGDPRGTWKEMEKGAYLLLLLRQRGANFNKHLKQNTLI